MSYKVEPLPNSVADLGEGPHWDIATQNLYYVDIVNGKLLRYDFNENKVYHCKIENVSVVGFVVPVEGEPNHFVVGAERDISVVEWDGFSETCEVVKVLAQVEQGDEIYDGNRFNDGKCDPRGRLYAGTMRYFGDHFEFRRGKFYKYNGGSMEVIRENIGISNGLAWNEETNKMYYIDTADFNVKEFDYDFTLGELKNPRVVIDLKAYEGRDKLLPDGMTIDSKGFLYIATFNGHSILQVNPKTGKIETEIKMPVKQITSVAFGGPNLDILYVTTANIFGESQPAGTTYKVTGLGVKGTPMAKFKLN